MHSYFYIQMIILGPINRNIIILFLLISALPVLGQRSGELKERGMRAYDQGDHYKAIMYLRGSLEEEGPEKKVLFFLANAKRKINNYNGALAHYEQLLAMDSSAFPQAWFYAGSMYRILGKYDQAQSYFLTYSLSNDTVISPQRVSQMLRSLDKARIILQDTVPVYLENPGSNINSPYTDFGAVQLSDQRILFSSLRPAIRGRHSGLMPRDFKTNIYISGISAAGYQEAQEWTSPPNHRRKHTASVAFSPDEQTMLFTRCREVKGSMMCRIFASEKEENQWSDPVPLPQIINMEGYNTTHPHLTYTAGQKVLYFVSDRPGGYGELDIWYSLIQNGRYTTPVNLGPRINTPGNEITPFYDYKDSVLYFSSDWHEGLGGYDIFKAKGGLASWEKPENMGYPINTSYNDLYYTLNENRFSGYLSSNRPHRGKSISDNCCNNIYYFEYEAEKPDTPVVTKPPEEPIDTLEVIITETRNLLPLTMYFDNDVPQQYEKPDTTIYKMDQLLESYLEKEQVYMERYPVAGSPDYEKDRQKIAAFFREVEEGKVLLDSLVLQLYEMLAHGEDIHLVVRGYASPLASEHYNLMLSKRRITALQNYLKEARNGILKPYLNNESPSDVKAKLTIYSQPMGQVDDPKIASDPADQRNAVYSPAAAKARKIVIEDVKQVNNEKHINDQKKNIKLEKH